LRPVKLENRIDSVDPVKAAFDPSFSKEICMLMASGFPYAKPALELIRSG
jgi:hypothetical protein